MITASGAKHDSVAHLNFIVNAYSNESGKLAITSQRVNVDGQISLVGSESGGTASQVKIVQVGFSSEFVVGASSANGSLKLMTVDMANSGSLERQGSIYGPNVTNLAMASLAPAGISKGIVTASKLRNGTLQLDSWKVYRHSDTDQLTVEHRDTVSEGLVSTIAVTALDHGRNPGEVDSFRGVVAAVRDVNQNLKVLAYSLSDTLQFTKTGEDIGGGVGNIELETVRLSTQRKAVIAAAQTDGGNLKMISYGVNAAGQIDRLDAVDAGASSHIALAGVNRNHVTTGLRSANDNHLRVLTWSISKAGKINRVGSVKGDLTTGVAAATAIVGAETFVVTSSRTPFGQWQYITWHANVP
ncbi:MAG: hypothetical protein ACR2P1_15785 [Pseudomonadales bacterium]